MSSKRHEQKYICSLAQMKHLAQVLASVLPSDKHQKTSSYHITSLYLDTPDDRFLSESLEGIPQRSKYRLRQYDRDGDHLKFEIKSSFFHLKQKRFMWVDKNKAKKFLQEKVNESLPDVPLLTEFYYAKKVNRIKPKLIIDYDRTAFVYDQLNVRITMDQNITSSTDVDSFWGGKYYQKPLLGKNQGILEVKFDDELPTHIIQLLSLEDLEQTSFSKYVMGRLGENPTD